MSYYVPATGCYVDPWYYMENHATHRELDEHGHRLCAVCLLDLAAAGDWQWVDPRGAVTEQRFNDHARFVEWLDFMRAAQPTPAQEAGPHGTEQHIFTTLTIPTGLTPIPDRGAVRRPTANGPLAGRIELDTRTGQPVFRLNLTDADGTPVPATVTGNGADRGIPPVPPVPRPATPGIPAGGEHGGGRGTESPRGDAVHPLLHGEARFAPPRSFPTARSTAATRDSYDAAVSLIRDARGLQRVRDVYRHIDYHLSFAGDDGVVIFTQEPRDGRPLICHEVDINKVAQFFRDVDTSTSNTGRAVSYPAIPLHITRDLRIEQIANDWLRIYQRFPARDAVIRVQLHKNCFRRTLTQAERSRLTPELIINFDREQSRKTTRTTWREWWARFIESSVGDDQDDNAHDFIRISLPERIWAGNISRRSTEGWTEGSIPFSTSRLLTISATRTARIWTGGNSEAGGVCCWGQGDRAVLRVEDLDNIFFESQFNYDLQRDAWNWLLNPATLPRLFPADATRIPATTLISNASGSYFPTGNLDDLMLSRRAPLLSY